MDDYAIGKHDKDPTTVEDFVQLIRKKNEEVMTDAIVTFFRDAYTSLLASETEDEHYDRYVAFGELFRTYDCIIPPKM